MSVSHARLGSGFIASLIHENLSSVLAPERCTLVLEEALVHAGLGSLPARGPALREFLERHLVGTLASVIDPSDARSVVDQIVAVLPPQILEDPVELPSAPPLPNERQTGRTREDLEVVIVTPSDGTFSRIARRFAPTAMVARHHRLESMHSTFIDPIVLIDARMLSPGSDPWHEVADYDVLLWGADSWSAEQVQWVLSFARSITRCPGEVQAEDLTAICGAMRMEGSGRMGSIG